METFDRHEFRKNGITASDAAVLMGSSTQSTPRKLYCEKIGLPSVVPPTYVLERHEDRKRRARAWYELFYDREMPPAAIVNRGVPWLRTVVDGISEDGRIVLLLGKFDQVKAQHILLVTGAEALHHVDFKHRVTVIEPDEIFLKRLLETEAVFWHQNVAAKVPPDRVKRDYKMIKGDVSLRCKLEQGEYVYDGEAYRCGPFYVNEKGVRRESSAKLQRRRKNRDCQTVP